MKNKTTRELPPIQIWKLKEQGSNRGETYMEGWDNDDGLIEINNRKYGGYKDFTDEDWDLLNDNYGVLLWRLNQELPTILNEVINNHRMIEQILEDFKRGEF